MTRRANPEFNLQVAVVAHLERRIRPNVYFTAIPMGENRSAVTGARIKRMGAKAGAPDMLVLVDGRACGLELKAAKGRMTMHPGRHAGPMARVRRCLRGCSRHRRGT